MVFYLELILSEFRVELTFRVGQFHFGLMLCISQMNPRSKRTAAGRIVHSLQVLMKYTWISISQIV